MRLPLSKAALLALGLVYYAAPPTHAQDVAATDEDVPTVLATVVIEPGHPARLLVMGQSSDPGVAAALGRIAGRPPESRDYGGWIQWTTELPTPSRHGLVLEQKLALEPLLAALERMGQPTLSLMIRHPSAGFVTLAGVPTMAVRPGHLDATLSTAPPYRPLLLELGWRGADVARAVGWLLFALLAPIAAALLVWRRSVARDPNPESWFGRAHTIQVITIAGWVLWMVVVEATKVADISAFALSGGSRLMTSPLWLVGFLPGALALGTITRRVVRRLRGFDPLPRGAVGSARVLVPLVLLLIAISAFGAGNSPTGVFALLACLASAVLLPGARGPLGTSPQALSSGALRDRLFDLAQRAGVRLRELYVVPLRRERMANAFAVNGGVVMVADELLDRMSRREVDALLAHEISHLEHRHPIKMVLAGLAAWGLVALVAVPFGFGYAIPAGVTASWLTYLFVARRLEFAADAGAAALTGDAEAMISGLGHLARLNQAPLAWGRARCWLITHPTTEARGHAIGRRAGLAPGRVAELLSHGLPDAERYGHRERPGEGERVFSTAWKGAFQGRLALAMLAAAVVAPAAGLGLARAIGLETAHVLVVLCGSALAFSAVLVVHDRFAARPVAGLEGALRRRLTDAADAEAAGRPPADASGSPGRRPLFVALSPGDRARVYEGLLDWDLGLLTIDPDRLGFRGEQVALDLPHHAVRSIDVGAVAPAWIRAPRVIVRWEGPTGEAALSLRAADSTAVSAIGPATQALAERLRVWRQAAPASQAGDPARSEVPPAIGPVTGRTLAEATAPRDLPLLVVLLGTLSAAASFVLGFDLWRGLDVFAAALIGMIAMRWPAMTSREPSKPKATAAEAERRAA